MSIKTRTSGIIVDINVEPTTTGWAGVTSGLTHHWPMDDANVSGTTITDIVGGLNATATGAGVTSAIGPSGAAGTARQFDGVDTASMASNTFADQVNTDVTFCVWIYYPDVTLDGPDGTLNPRFWCFSDGTEANGIDIVITGSSPLKINVDAAVGAGNAINNITNTAVLNSASWLHFALTKPGSGDFNSSIIYINSVTNTGATGGGGGGPIVGTNIFGGRTAAQSRLRSGSRIARVLTYQRVLSAAEILQNYNAF